MMRDEMSGEYIPTQYQSAAERAQQFNGDFESIGDEEIHLSGDDEDPFGDDEDPFGDEEIHLSGDELSGDEADLADHLVATFGEDVAYVGDEEMQRAIIGWSLGKALKKVVKKVAKSPLVKIVATGASFVCPAVGVPALAALTMADKLIKASKSPSASQRVAAKKMIQSTAQAAKRGDPDAQRGLSLLVNQAQQNKMPPRLAPGYKRVTHIIGPGGTIQRE